jgi:hypothetical protein
MPARRRFLAAGLGILLTAGCTADPVIPATATAPTPTPTPTPTISRSEAELALPPADTVVVAGATPAELAITASQDLFVHAPAVVLLGADDQADADRASATAVDLGVPLLLSPGPAEPAAPLAGELDRLGPRSVVTVGDAAAVWFRTQPSVPDRQLVATGTTPDDSAALPPVRPAPPLELLALSLNGVPETAAAIATVRATGARLLGVDSVDPRADGRAVAALAGAPTRHILAIGGGFGPPERLRQRVETAATGVQLPGGGQVVFPGRRMVALYGHPGDTVLGALGEQDLPATVARAQQVAAGYTALVGEPVVPAFDLIATIASAGAGADGDYSSESSVDFLRPWVDAAKSAGIYVVLDLQPGRTDFLTQAQRYTDLLVEPNVGLALDPEWRLKPDQVHLEQIGSVSADEINRTGRWLADLTRDHRLPQKILMVHQFRFDMITDRSTLVTDYDELSVVIHVDGFGSAGQKFSTWNALHIDEPPNIWWGWKDFYDEDKPTFTPQETVAVEPSPVFISYQ